MLMAIIAFLNRKGGVGKTSTTFHLAGALAPERRILLVDNDPQASLTQGIIGPVATAELGISRTIAALYQGAVPFPEALVRPTGFAGVELVPGGGAAEENRATPARALRAFLQSLAPAYDLVLIDCPPTLGPCSTAALVAANHLVIPLQAEDYGAQGIAAVLDAAARTAAGPNPALTVAGLLITMHSPRLAVHRAYEAQLRTLYGSDVFAATVPYAVDFKEAISRRLPVGHHKPRGAAARAIRALAGELLGRLAPATVEAA